jgi:hypothetical protein
MGGVLVAAVLGAWRWPLVGLVPPLLSLGLVVLSLVMVRRSGQPLRWGRILLQLVFPAVAFAVVLAFPRLAPVVPLVFLVPPLVTRSDRDERPWQRALAEIRFDTEAPPG